MISEGKGNVDISERLKPKSEKEREVEDVEIKKELTNNNFHEIIESICQGIEEDNMKPVLSGLSVLTKYLCDKKIISEDIFSIILDKRVLTFLVSNSLIDNTGDNTCNFLIPGDFFANLSFHNDFICNFLLEERKLDGLMCICSMTQSIEILVPAITVITNALNIYNIRAFCGINYLWKFLRVVESNQDNPLGVLISRLICSIVRTNEIVDVDCIDGFSNLLCDIIFNKENVSSFLMWSVYYIISNLFRKMVNSYDKEYTKYKHCAKKFLTEKLCVLFLEMIANKDFVPNEIALFCLSCIVIGPSNKAINFIDQNIDLDVIKEMILANDQEISRQALIFVGNYVNDVRIQRIIDAGIDTAVIHEINEGNLTLREVAANTFCAIYEYTVKSVKREWISEETMSSLIQMISNTRDTNLQESLCQMITNLIIEVPSVVFVLNNASVFEAIEDLENMEECDPNNENLNYSLFKVVNDLKRALEESSDSD